MQNVGKYIILVHGKSRQKFFGLKNQFIQTNIDAILHFPTGIKSHLLRRCHEIYPPNHVPTKHRLHSVSGSIRLDV